MFQSKYYSITQRLAEEDEAIYAHVMNRDIIFMQIRNDSKKLIILNHHTYLEYITECLEKNCYLIKSNTHKLADKTSIKIHQRF